MEKIQLSKENLNKLIDKNRYNIIKNRGGFGIVLPYENGLGLKFSADLIINNCFDEDLFREDLEGYKISEKQISYLANVQKNIKLSSLPKGVAYYNKKPVAVILKYFYNHDSLYNSSKEHSEVLYKMYKDVVIAVDELMSHGIYQLDIKESNFLYSKNDFRVQPIDFDGGLIRVGRGNRIYEERIYDDLIEMIYFMFSQKLVYLKSINCINEKMYNDKLSSLKYIKSFINDYSIYDRAFNLIEDVKDNKILEFKKNKY